MDRNIFAGKAPYMENASLSARRAWIEMPDSTHRREPFRSLSARRAWIEIIDYIIDYATDASLSARRAWIEISSLDDILAGVNVALRKESVDRNVHHVCQFTGAGWSLSARRAWIEMLQVCWYILH